MRRLLLTLFSILTFLPVFVFLTLPVKADENFETHLKTTYIVDDQGSARVTHEFKIVNKTPLFFITQYGLKVSSNSLTNVTVTNGSQRITPEVNTTKNETSIGITFPDRIVGENKERIFTISYTNPDATVVSGNVLEVYVPQLATTDTYSSYSLTLVTPLKYGEPTRIHPGTYTTVVEGSNFRTVINEAGKSSVVAVYGQEQYFKLAFRYHLENPTNGVRLMQIALPPDTPYQRLDYHALEPLPEKIESDADGNWIATYTLPANVTQVVNAEATVKLTLSPNGSVPVIQPTNQFLQADDYWPLNDTQVQEVVGEQSSVEDIYRYVLSTLEYDYDRVQENPVIRLGAAGALSEPHRAMCQEYTDLFITLSRAQGIPARRATGYAYTENEVLRPLSFVQDTLHAWPEYFNTNQNRWVPIDPTWEDTAGGINYFDQFDLNHIVFAYNGSDSELPLPAGSYKTQNIETKDVEVTFGDRFITQEPSFQIIVDQLQLGTTPLKSVADLQFINNLGQAVYNLPVTITTDDLLDWQRQTHTLQSVLPFQTATLPVRLVSDSWWRPQKVTLDITYGDQATEITITAAPKIIGQLTHPYVLLGVGIGVVGLTLGTWSLLVLRQKRRSPVRR
ncbi:MAG TPA: transglutaminase domain-containing protein [Patescibacteria group bacterium]